MKRYKSLIETISYSEDYSYWQFCEYVIASDYGELLIEWKLPFDLVKKLEFMRELAIQTKIKIKDIFILFMNKYVFKLFEIINWNLKNLFEMLKTGYNYYQNFKQAIIDYIEQNQIIKWTKDHLLKLDSFLSRHPKTKRLTGVAIGLLLLYMWLTMTFIGNPTFDFDISMIIDSLMGKLSFADIFGGAAGTVFLTLFLSGLIFKLAFPWPGSNLVKLAIAVLITLGKKLKVSLQKGKTTDKEIEKFL